ncbi:MAG TPA: hypothetical protein VK168_06060 [Saprospiraceae bacterium]|nr:hypothetical protein [Saprospiraceae bacterium]
MNENSFSWKRMGMVLLLTIAVGIGQYFVAHQFNDGKMGQKVYGGIFIGMAIPSLLLGGVMRLFRPTLQRYFAITAGLCLFTGLLLLLL